MNTIMTPEDATLVIGFLTSIAVPFVVSYLKRCEWSDWQKLLVAIIVSTLGAIFSLYASGEGFDVHSVVRALGVIATEASIWYHTWFKSLGLDEKIQGLTTK